MSNIVKLDASTIDFNDGTFTELENMLFVNHMFKNPKMAWKTVYIQYKDTVTCFENKKKTGLVLLDKVGTRVYVKNFKENVFKDSDEYFYPEAELVNSVTGFDYVNDRLEVKDSVGKRMLISFNYHDMRRGFYSSCFAECDNIVDQNINLLDAFYSVTGGGAGCVIFEILVYVKDHDGTWTYTSVNQRVFARVVQRTDKDD